MHLETQRFKVDDKVVSPVGVHDEETNLRDRRRGRAHNDQERHHRYPEAQGQSYHHYCTWSETFGSFLNYSKYLGVS